MLPAQRTTSTSALLLVPANLSLLSTASLWVRAGVLRTSLISISIPRRRVRNITMHTGYVPFSRSTRDLGRARPSLFHPLMPSARSLYLHRIQALSRAPPSPLLAPARVPGPRSVGHRKSAWACLPLSVPTRRVAPLRPNWLRTYRSVRTGFRLIRRSSRLCPGTNRKWSTAISSVCATITTAIGAGTICGSATTATGTPGIVAGSASGTTRLTAKAMGAISSTSKSSLGRTRGGSRGDVGRFLRSTSRYSPQSADTDRRVPPFPSCPHMSDHRPLTPACQRGHTISVPGA
ncbi:hypothetical protein GY45DRAFT_682685 [Cubamyces sp. BRFM 1775]|nr:hypothetical protein GY45DRAFT_682685 [Cubamyces sp. BRFM 1775]